VARDIRVCNVSGGCSKSAALIMLFLVGVLNLFDRQILNVLAQSIKTELHLSDLQLGLLSGTAFGLLYAGLGIPLGHLADRVDRIKLIAGILALWSVCTALCGAAANFSLLFIARMGVGVGEAGSQPATTSLIPDYFAEERRTSAMSALLVAAPVGSFCGLLLGGWVGSVFGWRTAFLVAGVPGIVLAIVMRLTLRDPQADLRGAPSTGRAAFLKTVRDLFATRRLGWLAVALASSTFLIYASGAWFPPLFIRVHGMSMKEIGAYSAMAVGGGGLIGTLGGGFLCDLMRNRVAHIESRLVIWVLLVCIPALLVAALSVDRRAALFAMFIFNVCAYAWLGPTVRLIQKDSGRHSQALAVAICTSLASTLSLCVGLPLVGAISDALTPAFGAGAIRYALVLTVAAAAAMGIFAHWRALRTPPQAANPLSTSIEIEG
jgi:MFS transporter, Spinster family, sphingosine-1-phosphate transporter